MVTRYKRGSWNAIDDVSGFKCKADKMRLRWDGMYVTKENWEPRHPQEFLRARTDNMSVPWARPRPADIFIPGRGAYGVGTVDQAFLNGSIVNGRSIPLRRNPLAVRPHVEKKSGRINDDELNGVIINGKSSIL